MIGCELVVGERERRRKEKEKKRRIFRIWDCGLQIGGREELDENSENLSYLLDKFETSWYFSPSIDH